MGAVEGALWGIKVTSELVTLILHLADLPREVSNIPVKYAEPPGRVRFIDARSRSLVNGEFGGSRSESGTVPQP